MVKICVEDAIHINAAVVAAAIVQLGSCVAHGNLNIISLFLRPGQLNGRVHKLQSDGSIVAAAVPDKAAAAVLDKVEVDFDGGHGRICDRSAQVDATRGAAVVVAQAAVGDEIVEAMGVDVFNQVGELDGTGLELGGGHFGGRMRIQRAGFIGYFALRPYSSKVNSFFREIKINWGWYGFFTLPYF